MIKRAVIMARTSDNMAENVITSTVTTDPVRTTTGTVTIEPVKTTTDLAIEKLTARLDALENENAELKQANKGLWAELHPVQPTAAPTSAPVSTTPPASGPTDYEIVVKQLGIKEE